MCVEPVSQTVRSGAKLVHTLCCLPPCASIFLSVCSSELDLDLRAKVAEDTDEAQQAEARGAALLQKADAHLKEGKFIETRDYLGAAR